MLICGSMAFGQYKTYWTESFEQSVWSTASSSTTDSMGTWTLSGVSRTTSKHNTGSAAMTIGSAGYVMTPIVSGGVSSISFYTSSGGSARTLTAYSTTDGSTFVQVGSISTGTSSGFSAGSFTITDASVKAVKLSITSTSGSAYIDDITLVSMISPTIIPSAVTLTDFGVLPAGNISSSQSFAIRGTSLSNAVAFKASSGFTISLDNINFTDSLTLSISGDSVGATTIYARFNPTSAMGTTSGKITLTSAGATTKIITVSGTAIAAEPTIISTVSTSTITGTSVVINFSGGDGVGRIAVVKAGSVVVWTPIDGTEPSGVSNDFTSATIQSDSSRIVYRGTGNTVTITDLTPGATYFVSVYEYNGTATASENYLTSSAGTANFTTSEEPGLTVDPSTLAFGNVVQGLTSSEKTISVSGKYLTPESGTITLTVPTGFSISTTSGSGFSSSIDLSYSSNTLTATTMYVNFTPTSKIAYIDSISVNGGGASTKEVNVTGKGIDSAFLYIKVYYVDSTGNDSNPGTISAPFYSIWTATALAKAGDTIYVRGGTYYYAVTDNLTQSGTSDAWRICVFNYPGEHPIFNYKNQTYGAAYRAFVLSGNYWYFKGIEICYAGDNGMKLEGSHNIIERCIFHHNGDSGIQLGFGHQFEDTHPGVSKNDGTYCANNYVHNCDSYLNFDPDSNGGDADGMSCKMHPGMNNLFRGCRSWHNSDDGWDLFETDYPVYIDSCWTWDNGEKADFGGVAGNGNGFKLGGNGTGGNSVGTHVVTNCIAFNIQVRAFDQNSHQGGVIVRNCLAFNSAYSYMFEKSFSSGVVQEFTNCAEFGHTGAEAYEFVTGTTCTNDTWTLGLSASASDYVTINVDSARAPREADGSLPKNGFCKLKSTSSLIDKGTNVGLAYAGSFPDVGPFEYGTIVTSVNGNASSNTDLPKSVAVKNYPNPFNPSTNIQFTVNREGLTTLKVYDLLGHEVVMLLNSVKKPGTYIVQFDASRLGSGVYFSVLQSGSQRVTTKMLLMK
jgi:hypothetical protein